MRIFKGNEPEDQYRRELEMLVSEGLEKEKHDLLIQMAEKKYIDFRKERGEKELARIVIENAGIKPETQPRAVDVLRFPEGWQKEGKRSGQVITASKPEAITERLLDPLQANYRRLNGGRSHLKDELAAVLGECDRRDAETQEVRDLAGALLVEVEKLDKQPPQKLHFRKIDPIKAGMLPRSAGGAVGTTRWPPVSESERQNAAKKFPQYAHWLSMDDELVAEVLPEDLRGFYELEDPIRREHDKIMQKVLMENL